MPQSNPGPCVVRAIVKKSLAQPAGPRASAARCAARFALASLALLWASPALAQNAGTQPTQANPPSPAEAAPSPAASAPLTLPADASELIITSGLVLPASAPPSRRPFAPDPFIAAIVDGALAGPEAPLPPGAKPASADANNAFPNLRRGEVLVARVVLPEARTLLLDAQGHALVYVNGEPRGGDVYAHGYVQLPVALRAGENRLLFVAGGRGIFRAALRAPRASVQFLPGDVTLGDLVPALDAREGDGLAMADVRMAVPMANVQPTARRVGVRVRWQGEVPARARVELVEAGGVGGDGVTLAPLEVRKLPLRVRVHAPALSADVALRLEVFDPDATRAGAGADASAPAPWDQLDVLVPIRGPRERHEVTFTSLVDDSVQYYAVVPQAASAGADGAAPSSPPALVLSLHGAAVEATSQAASYAPKERFVVVAPTNRRPFGFNWEDWGRIDALEVLSHARVRYATDPTRVFLTGHSMGGHGTWQLGVLYPHIFAAIAPSAGWLSFDTYMRSVSSPALTMLSDDTPGPIARAFRASIRSSDTPALLPGLRSMPISILHGDADDNVPVSEARLAAQILRDAGIPFTLFEQPGAGHWWTGPLPAGFDASQWGAACLDWPPFFTELFAGAAPRTPPTWLATPALPTIDDGRNASPTTDASGLPLLDQRGFPLGGFKRVFDRGFVLVYATQGTPEENAWSLALARAHAEHWWYQANGHAPLMSDAQVVQSPALVAGRNVILYGHAGMNAAWRVLAASDASVLVERGRAAFAGREFAGDDLSAIAIIARAGVPNGAAGPLLGVVAGTGPRALRALDRAPLFSPGVGIPEGVLLRADVWRRGLEAIEGVIDGAVPAGSAPMFHFAR